MPTRKAYILLSWLAALVSVSAAALAIDAVPAAALNSIVAEPLVTPAIGAAQGDVTVVEYFDYNCPVCRHLEPQLRKLIVGDPQVRLIRKDWPVFGDASVYAAYCVFAAARQGKYAAAHDALIGTAKDLDSREDVQQVLRDAGFDLHRLDADIAVHEAEYAAVLARNKREAAELGLRGTPGLIVGNQLAPGGMDAAQLKSLVQRARQGSLHQGE
jgi:protein-disulfide isomerase